MGSPIQISVTEILQSLERAKKVYDSFNDEFDSADNRIKELFGTSQLLHGVLAESEELLLRCNRTFPAHESFIKKLRELDRFIDKYSTLRPSEGSAPHQCSTIRSSTESGCSARNSTRFYEAFLPV